MYVCVEVWSGAFPRSYATELTWMKAAPHTFFFFEDLLIIIKSNILSLAIVYIHFFSKFCLCGVALVFLCVCCLTHLSLSRMCCPRLGDAA